MEELPEQQAAPAADARPDRDEVSEKRELGFADLGLSPKSLAAIASKGFETPSPIQRMAIPVLLSEECDIIGQAQTGTGKTAAFGLPILEQIEPENTYPQALILAPTRELALQVTQELISFKGDPSVQLLTVYGGQSISEQQRRLRKGMHIVVGTPGRILDLLRRGDLKLDRTQWVILDEADEMLNMGFIDDVEDILKHVTGPRRMMLFSATMPDRIVKLSKKYMKDVKILQVDRDQKPTHLADQIYFEVRESNKFDALTRIIDIEPEFFGLVFCRTRNQVDDIVMRLAEQGYSAEGLHGEISQAQREKTLAKFRKKLVNIMVATDVAARGIDISDLSHVINYSLPQDPESYVHRVGRTGRAGKEGTAITFVTPAEYKRLLYFQKSIKFKIRKETLPNAEDIVEVKRMLLLEQLYEMIENGNYELYMDMAEEILASHEPQIALAALFNMAYKSDLDVSNYQEIRGFAVDKQGATRLFIAQGKRDGYTPRSLVDYVCEVGRVRSRDIEDVAVLEEFSFITVPFKEGKRLLDAFASLRVDGKPMMTKAKSKR
ncbi:MAG: RNA helicase [Bacteroidia bacterium]|nr:MAG: RNA helicase [Bacteroidia bacterium]